MSIFLDTQYLNQISLRLDQFSKHSHDVWNARCPFCGDSKTSKTKARGYFFAGTGRMTQSLMYKCHNCGVSMPFGKFLKHIDPVIFSGYIIEKMKEDGTPQKQKKEEILPPKSEQLIALKKSLDFTYPWMCPVMKLGTQTALKPEEQLAWDFLHNRLIPAKHWDLFYFLPETRMLNNLSARYFNRFNKGEPRIVIPFYNKYNDLIGLTARALDPTINPRYITCKIKEDEEMVFGFDRVDSSKRYYVTEGPIDSLFLENAVAVGGSALKRVEHMLDIENAVLIFDNQPRNKEVVKIIRAAILNDFNICIWPEVVSDYKDINEMVQGGMEPSVIQDLIDQRTYRGLTAMLKFNEWKKC